MFSSVLTLGVLLLTFVVVALAMPLIRKYQSINLATFALVALCVESAYVILVSIAYFFKLY